MIDRKLHRLLPVLFIVLCGPLSIVLAMNEPPGQVPDESGHAVKAYSLLSGELLGHREVVPLVDGRTGQQQGVDADFAIFAVSNEPSPAQLTADHWAAVHAVNWGKNSFQTIGTLAGYWPGFYLPATAGLGIAKALGASPFDAFMTARLFQLTTYLSLGFLALLLAQRVQVLLFCTLSVPMSLHLGASVNQDGLLIATSVLAVALLTRSGKTGEALLPIRQDAARLWSAVCIAAVVLAKPPYVPIAGLLLLPLVSFRMRDVWVGRLALVAGVLVCAVGWIWITVHFVATPIVRPPAEAGPLWPGPRPAIFSGTDMAAQLQVLMAKPVRFLTLPWRTLIHHGILIDEGIGILGYLQIHLPNWLYLLWFWAIGSAVLADLLWTSKRAVTLPAWQAGLPVLCAVATFLGIFLSQYLSWTEVGGDHIEGPQGRYFLPLIPVIAFALPSIVRSPSAALVLRMIPICACLADLIVVPGVVIRYFYMH